MTIEATAGDPVQLTYHAFARKDCTPAPVPPIHVIQAPKAGELLVREVTLTTDKVAGCPPINLPTEVVSYKGREGYAGPDHATYEVMESNGEVRTYDLSITVKLPPASMPLPKEKGATLQRPI